MAKYRKQHILPTLSLKRFTDANGHVWNYNKNTGRKWNKIPEESGVISHFYSYSMPDGSISTDIEETLQKIESDAEPAYEKLLFSAQLSLEERFAFAHFLSSMYFRTASMRRMAAKIIATELQHRFAVHSRFANSEVPAETRQAWKDLSNLSLTVPKGMTLGMLAGADKLAEIFSNMTWSVCIAKQHYFVTSDNPVHRAVDTQTIHPIYGDNGFYNQTAQITFPLSPKKLLLLTHLDEAVPILEIPREQVANENRKRAYGAETLLFAHVSDRRIERLLLKFKDKRPEIKVSGFAGTKGFGEVKVSRTKARPPGPSHGQS